MPFRRNSASSFRRLVRTVLVALTLAATARAQIVLTWSSGDILSPTSGLGLTLTVPILSNLYTINISGTSSHTINGRAVVNDTTINWTGGSLLGSQGATFTNNGSFNDSSTGTMGSSGAGGATMTFTNASTGTYNASATKTISAFFTNNGNVSVSTGTLTLGGGGTNSGTLSAASGAALTLSNDFTLASGSTLSGAGTINATGGTLTASGAISSSNLVLAGAALAGTQTFTGSVTWNSGDWSLSSGSATTTIATGSTLTIGTTASHTLNRRSLENNGTITWNAGVLQLGNGATLTNVSGATFTDNAASTISNPFGGTATFVNEGFFHKLSTGNTTISTAFNNNSSVLVSTGNLFLSGGGTHGASGVFNVDPGAVLTFSGGTHTLASGTSLIGSGDIRLTGGNITLPSGSVTFENLSQSSGTLSGAGDLTIIGYVHTGGSMTASNLSLTGASSGWYGGDWNSSSASTATLSADTTFIIATGTHDFNRRTITNYGTISWTGGALRTGNGGSLVNAADGIINDTASSSLTANLGGTGSFINDGTYNKNGAGTSTISLPLTLNGTINVNSGTLNLDSGATIASSALFYVSKNGTLGFTGGNYTIPSATNLAIAEGAITITTGNVTLSSGGFNPSSLALSGGNFTVADATATSTIPTATISGGTFNAPGNVTFTTLTQSGGSLNLTTLALLGNVTWSGGDWNSTAASTGSIASGATVTLSGSGTHDFNRRVLTNNGTITWSGGSFRTGNGGGLVNAAGATINDSANSSLNGTFGGTGAAAPFFTNDGTYNKNGSGTSTISLALQNNGTINVNAGTLNLDAGGTLGNASLLNTASGTTLGFAGGNFTLASAANLSLAGNVSITSGNVTLSSGAFAAPALTLTSGTFTIADRTASTMLPVLTLGGGTLTAPGNVSITSLAQTGGTLNVSHLFLLGNATWTAGDWNSTAASTGEIAKNVTLTLSGTSAHDFNRRLLTNEGTIAWNGGSFRTGNGGGLINAAGATINDSANSSLNGDYGGTGVAAPFFTNNGTYNKNGTGTSTFSLVLQNSGTINLNAGTLNLNGTSSTLNGSSILNAASGTTLGFTSGNTTIASAANLSLLGNVSVAGGNVTLTSGALSVGALAISSSTLTLSDATATSALPSLALSGGTFNAAGNVTLNSLTQTGGSLAVASLTLLGNATWTSGNWTSAAASTGTIASGVTLTLSTTSAHDYDRRMITNNGTIDWTAGQFRTGNGGGIVNAFGGVFNDTANSNLNRAWGGTGTFTNQGAYNKNGTGTSTIDLTFANTGVLNLNAGTLIFAGGGSDLGTGVINSGAGTTLEFNSGNFTIGAASNLNLSGAVRVSGGNVTLFGGALVTSGLTQTNGLLTLTDATVTTALPTLALSGGTLSAAGAVTTPALTQSGGSLSAAVLSVLGNSTWSAGDWNTSTASTASLASGATLTISSTSVHDFNRRLLTNSGIIDWTGGQLRTGNGGGLVNAAGGVINDTANSSFNAGLGGMATFTNDGVFNKNGSGTSTLDIQVTNQGAINLNAGLLVLSGGGSTTGNSTLTVAGNATLRFGGGNFTLGNATHLAATGTVSVTGGNVTFDTGLFTLPSLTMSAGNILGNAALSTPALSLTGGSLGIATLTLTGNATWNAGDLNSAAASTATIASGATLFLTSTGAHDFNRRTITNSGTLEWQGGQFRSGNGGAFLNTATGIVNDTASSTFNAAYNNGATFSNAGIYNKNATGTSTFSTTFNNDGTVNVNLGTFSLTGGGTTASSGRFNVATGAALNFGAGNYTIADGASLTGAGSFSLTGGTLTLSSGSVALPNLTVTNGTLAGAGTASIASLNQTGGSLGLASFTLTGPIIWTGGDWSSDTASTATLASGTTLTLTNSSSHAFSRRTVTSNGTINWTGGYVQTGQGGGLINNGTFNDTQASNWQFYNPFGGTASFTNNGTYTRNAANSTTYIDVAFTNTGSVQVLGGDLQFRGGGSMSAAGTMSVASGMNVYFTNGFTVADGVSLTGAGAYRLTGGTFDVTGALSASTLYLDGGTLAGTHTLSGVINWTDSSLSAATTGFTTTIASGATFNLTTGNNKDFNRRALTNHGTLNWSGGYLRGGNGSVFTNNGQFTDTQLSNYQIYNPFGGTFSFVNNGTYTRNGANSTTYLDAAFTNNATVQVLAGDLQFRGGGTFATGSTINAAPGTNVHFTDDFSVANGASLTGTGAYLVTGGTFTVNGTLNVSSLSFSGGNLGGTHTLNGAISWTNGSWSSATAGVSTTIASGATLAIGTSGSHQFNRRSIVNDGSVTWTLGYLDGGNGSTFVNNGTFTDLNTSSYSIRNPSFGGTFVFTNNGSYVRSAINSTTYIDVPFDNNGTVTLTAGDLQFRGGGTLAATGSISAASGTNVYFTDDYTVSNGSSLTGAGAYRLTGGDFTLNGQLNVSSFTQTGGTLAGTGTINGTFNWNGGDWNVAATGPITTISATGNLTLGNGAYHDFNRRTIVNDGTATWTSGYIRGGNGSVFQNNGTFNDANSSGYSFHNPDFGGTAGTFVFSNNGTYTRNVGSTTYFDITFNNQGTVNLQQGDIRLQGGGTLGVTSVVNVASGTHFYLSSNYTLLDGAQFTGSGLVNQIAGTLTADGTLRASNFVWSGGNWNAANNSGLTTTIAAGSTLTLSNNNDSTRDFNGRGIINQGTINWQNGYLRGGNGSSLVNYGTFNDQNSSGYSMYNPSFGSSAGTFSFTNHGTYNRNVGSTTYFSIPFNNHGRLNLQQGDIHLLGGGTMAATSVVNVSSGAHLYFMSDYSLVGGAQFTGAGLINQTNGTLTVNGALSASGFLWSGGNWNAANSSGLTTTIAPGTILTLASGSDSYRDFNGRTIVNEGILNWQSAWVRGSNGSAFVNNATFNDQNGSSYSFYNPSLGGSAGTFTFTNNGTYHRAVGGTTYFDTTFNNHGTLNLQQGDIRLQGGGTMSATSLVNTATGTNLFITDDYTLLAGSRFRGTGYVAQTGGTLTVGTLDATAFHWTGGDWNGAGTSTNAAGSTLNLTGSGNRDFDARTIVNNGTVNWSSGYLRSGNGGSFTNAAGGTFNDLNSPGYAIQNAFGGGFTFTNNGTYVKSASGTSYIQVPFVNNGTLIIQTGTLSFSSTLTNTGTIQTNGGNLSLPAGGTLNLGTGALQGTGTITASNVIAGGIVAPGNSPGALSLTGNLTLLATSQLIIELGGTTPGSGFDVLNVGGTTLLAGSLQVNLFGFYPTTANTFTFINSTGLLTGTFTNALNNSRLLTQGGEGSFLVTYGANNVTLSNFQAIPEPSTYLMLAAGSLAIVYTVRRRRR